MKLSTVSSALVLPKMNYIFKDLESDFGYAVEREKSIIRQNKCQVDRVKTTLKQIMRDWSYLGKCERDAAYKPVLEEIERIFCNKNGKLISNFKNTFKGRVLN